jgi:hypothetical protein
MLEENRSWEQVMVVEHNEHNMMEGKQWKCTE